MKISNTKGGLVHAMHSNGPLHQVIGLIWLLKQVWGSGNTLKRMSSMFQSCSTSSSRTCWQLCSTSWWLKSMTGHQLSQGSLRSRGRLPNSTPHNSMGVAVVPLSKWSFDTLSCSPAQKATLRLSQIIMNSCQSTRPRISRNFSWRNSSVFKIAAV